MSRLDQLQAEKVVLLPLLDPPKADLPMARLRQFQIESVVLLPLLGGTIAGIVCLVRALTR
jgi:hypothetical protein